MASTATGLRFPLGAAGGFGLVRGTDRLEQGMRLILWTYPGERVQRPAFGSRLRDYVFEPLTAPVLARLADEVERALTIGEPRVTIESVEAHPDPLVEGLVRIVVGYREREEPRQFTVDLRTDRFAAEAG